MDFRHESVSCPEGLGNFPNQEVDRVDALRLVRKITQSECLSDPFRRQDANPRSDMDHLTFVAEPRFT